MSISLSSDYFEEMGWLSLRDGEAPSRRALLAMTWYLRDYRFWEILGVHKKRPLPASKNAVDTLREPEIKPRKTEQCPVCLKEFEANDKAKSMPYYHVFHQDNSCPLCQYELPTDDEEYEVYRKEKAEEKKRLGIHSYVHPYV